MTDLKRRRSRFLHIETCSSSAAPGETQRQTHKKKTKYPALPRPPSTCLYKCQLLTFTLEETLDAEVGHGEAQHGQLVQLGDDIRGERQQAGQPVQLGVQPVSVPLGRVGFLVGRGRLPGHDTGADSREPVRRDRAELLCHRAEVVNPKVKNEDFRSLLLQNKTGCLCRAASEEQRAKEKD